MANRRFKYGIFFHPLVTDVQAAATRLTEELVGDYRDPFAPELGAVTVRSPVQIVRYDDTVVHAAPHAPGHWSLVTDDQTGPNRAILLEVLDWWNGETLLVAPEAHQLVWDGPSLPNAWTEAWHDGLVLQTITQYPKRLGHRALAEWNPGLTYLPFEFTVELATPEQEAEARNRWVAQCAGELRAVLETLPVDPARPWFSAGVRRYRGALVPDPTTLKPVGTQEEAEAWAQTFGGLCCLVNGATGESVDRWANR